MTTGNGHWTNPRLDPEAGAVLATFYGAGPAIMLESGNVYPVNRLLDIPDINRLVEKANGTGMERVLDESMALKDRAMLVDLFSTFARSPFGLEKPRTTWWRSDFELIRWWGKKSPPLLRIEGSIASHFSLFSEPRHRTMGLGWYICHRDSGRPEFKPSKWKKQEYDLRAKRVEQLLEERARPPFENGVASVLTKCARNLMAWDRVVISKTRSMTTSGESRLAWYAAVDGSTIRPLQEFLDQFMLRPWDDPLVGTPATGSDWRAAADRAYDEAARVLDVDVGQLKRDHYDGAAWVQVPPAGAVPRYAYFRYDDLIVGVMDPDIDPRAYGYGTSPRERAVYEVEAFQMAFEFTRRRFTDGLPPGGMLTVVHPAGRESRARFEAEIMARGSGFVNAQRFPLLWYDPMLYREIGRDPVRWVPFSGSGREEQYREYMGDMEARIAAHYWNYPIELQNTRPPTVGSQPFSQGQPDVMRETSKLAWLQVPLRWIAAKIMTPIVEEFDPEMCFRFGGLEGDRRKELAERLEVEMRLGRTVESTLEELGIEPFPPGDPRNEVTGSPWIEQARVQAEQAQMFGGGREGGGPPQEEGPSGEEGPEGAAPSPVAKSTLDAVTKFLSEIRGGEGGGGEC